MVTIYEVTVQIIERKPFPQGVESNFTPELKGNIANIGMNGNTE